MFKKKVLETNSDDVTFYAKNTYILLFIWNQRLYSIV